MISTLELKALLNSSLTCSKCCYRCLPYQNRGQESCKFQYNSLAPANSKTRLVAFPWPKNNDNTNNSVINSKNPYILLLVLSTINPDTSLTKQTTNILSLWGEYLYFKGSLDMKPCLGAVTRSIRHMEFSNAILWKLRKWNLNFRGPL